MNLRSFHVLPEPTTKGYKSHIMDDYGYLAPVNYAALAFFIRGTV